MRNMCGTIFYIKTYVLQDFHTCMSVPLSMHLASLTITWKPTNKDIDNFISYLKSKLINWFQKW